MNFFCCECCRRPYLHVPTASDFKSAKAASTQIPCILSAVEDAEGEGGNSAVANSPPPLLVPAGEVEGERDLVLQPSLDPPSPLPQASPSRILGWKFNAESSVFASRLKESDAKVCTPYLQDL